MKKKTTYRSQNQCDGSNRNWFEHMHILNAFIPFVLEPHKINCFLNYRVLVHPLAFCLLCLGIDEDGLNVQVV